LYEIKDKIAWITLNRPESLNAVNREMVKSIVEYCRQAEEDRDVQVVIFKGNGERAFSVGGDIKDRARQNAAAVEQSESPLVQRQSKFSAIPGTPAPAIAAMNKITMALVHGYCVGTGLLMSLACDLRVAADDAKLGLTEVRRGIIPGAGGTQRLTRAVGITKAMEMCLTGDTVSGQEAKSLGLVNSSVPSADVLTAAEELASRILKGAPISVAFIKEAIKKGIELPLEEGLRLEADLSALIGSTEDAKEGPRAFAEKRAAVWKGK
jgi:enoyl-CoA hydratase